MMDALKMIRDNYRVYNLAREYVRLKHIAGTHREHSSHPTKIAKLENRLFGSGMPLSLPALEQLLVEARAIRQSMSMAAAVSGYTSQERSALRSVGDRG